MPIPEDFILIPLEGPAITHLADKVDGWVTEGHRVTMATSDHPVESGADITDNAVRQPRELTLPGVVSNLLPAVETDAPAEQRNREAWETVQSLMENRVLMDVATSIWHYRDMLIVEATSDRSVRTGYGLEFQIKLREILRFEVQAGRFSSANVSGPAADRTSQVDEGTKQSPEGMIGQQFDPRNPQLTGRR